MGKRNRKNKIKICRRFEYFLYTERNSNDSINKILYPGVGFLITTLPCPYLGMKSCHCHITGLLGSLQKCDRLMPSFFGSERVVRIKKFTGNSGSWWQEAVYTNV